MKPFVHRMINLSIVINVIVLFPVISVILLNLVQVERVWGENQPSRQILVSIYIAILLASILVNFLKNKTKVLVAITIFSMQIVYKVLTAVLVFNAFSNPVVLSNLAITLVHLSTIFVVFKYHPDLLN